jgi:small-conductance mechanosensitive channel
MSQLYASLSVLATETLTGISVFLPRLAAAILILIIGAGVAKGLKKLVVKLLETLKVSSWVKNTPVEHFFKNAEFGEKIEGVLGSIVYWILMLVVIHSTVSVLGLSSLTHVLDRVLTYVPRIISSILVLFFGLLIAGVVDSLVKGSIMSVDGKSARLLGKVSSYLVLIIVVLAAINELGIASEFIMVMFVGFIVMLSLGLGLAIGLGGQHLVKDIFSKWYKQTSKEVRKK